MTVLTLIKNKNWIKTLVVWLPSILVAIFFIQNAIEKIVKSTELDKASLSPTQIMIVGMVLLVATTMYLIDKTLIIGTVVLALYMISVVIIHFNNGKPYIIASQIVLAILYGAYMRGIKIVAKD
jgi:hypothetical protein